MKVRLGGDILIGTTEGMNKGEESDKSGVETVEELDITVDLDALECTLLSVLVDGALDGVLV